LPAEWECPGKENSLRRWDGNKEKKMSKYQTFTPGKYFDWEKAVIEERLEHAGKGPPKDQQPPIVVSVPQEH
jgi:hypothetical protein